MLKRIALVILLLLTSLTACSHSVPVKEEAYASLSSQRTYEYDFPTVWKGIEFALRDYKITKRDPQEVGELAMRHLTERKLETDWIYTQSEDKYVTYQVNGTPRRQQLQTRIKYHIIAASQIGGVTVKVKTIEEIEQLSPNGAPNGYTSVSNPDPARAGEILDKIKLALISLAP